MDQQQTLLASMLAFLVLTTIMVAGRCYIRIVIVKSFGLDDYFMAISYALFAVLIGLLIVSIHYGLGKHAIGLTPNQQINAAKYLIIGELVYIADSGFVKISVAILLLRIASKPVYRWTIHISIAVVALWTAATFVAVALQCRPLSLAWNPATGPGTCMKPIHIANFGYAFSALDIASDCLYSLLPVAMLWNVQMTWKVKASVCLILSMGLLASTATIVRLKYLIAVADQTDVLFSITTAQMWSVLETGIGISAACLATFRPLFRKLHLAGWGGSDKTSGKFVTGDTHHNAQELGYIRQTNGRGVTTEVEGGDNDSQEFILDQDQIHKRVDVSVQRTT